MPIIDFALDKYKNNMVTQLFTIGLIHFYDICSWLSLKKLPLEYVCPSVGGAWG